jgi:DNA-directed RNA polymerase specialized sigma24 family protein
VSEPDPVAASLEDLVTAVQHIDALARETAERAERLRAQREQGAPYRAILSAEQRPFPVDLVNKMTDALIDAGGKFQRAQAKALYEEGATMDQIAELFGISRQRVSTLLARTRQRSDE